MRRGVHGLIAALLAWTTAGAQVPAPAFRSEVRLVTVNAAVEVRGRPLPGLVADDFVLLDNGVQQTVMEVAYDTVPADVTMILDTSRSMAAHSKTIERDAQRIASFLRPTERLRMLAIDTYVHELAPFGPARTLPVRPPATIGGASAVLDALAAALIVPADPNRRRLVVALTDRGDSASGTSAARLVSMARASDSVLIVVQYPPPPGTMIIQNYEPAAKLPYQIGFRRPLAVDEAARITGGEVLRPSNNQIRAVEQIIDLFRQSYVLRYTPEGVEPGGWHEIELHVKGQPSASVRARSGYFGG